MVIRLKTKTLKELVESLELKGGHVNKYYIRNPNKSPSLVFYKNWFRGKNIRDAITRALAS